VSATIIGASELFQKYYPGIMTEANLKKFKILSEGDTNMAGKAEIELRRPSLLTSRNTIKPKDLNQYVYYYNFTSYLTKNWSSITRINWLIMFILGLHRRYGYNAWAKGKILLKYALHPVTTLL
jgi:hypothetical protein